MPTPPLTKKQRFEMLRSQLDLERQPHITDWRDLVQYIAPARGRFQQQGPRKIVRNKIIDSTATFSARVLSSGMNSGITSAARAWYRLTHPDPDLSESWAVKEWLHTVTERMRTVFIRSNLHNTLPDLYTDLGIFGTGVMFVEENFETTIRCQTFPVGSYYLANDSDRRARVFMREFQMTVRQMIEKFGEKGNGEIDWSKFSVQAKSLWETGQTEQRVDIVHVVAPNADYNVTKLESKFKPFLACYYEKGDNGTQFLEESGFDEFPVLAARWNITGDDAYGTESPGLVALGDIKQLQFGEKSRAQAIEKIIKPPMTADPDLRQTRLSILPGDVSYVKDGEKTFRPTHPPPSVHDLLALQYEIRDRIKVAFYENLFLMLASNQGMDRGDKTAREIEERHEEKFLVLGSMLEQLNQDVLDPLIDRTFGIMVRRGDIPEAPEELQGAQLKVEYVSIMAQAQKRVGIAGLQEFTGFGTSLAQFQPSALDKIDFDQVIDEVAEMTGVPPRVVVPDETVQLIREQRAQAEKAMRDAEAAKTLAGAAKDMSQTDTGGKNALTDIMAGVGASE